MDHDARIELWENGILVRAGIDTAITGADQVLSFTWNANELATADGSLVQCKVIGTKAGGAPGARNAVNIGGIEWNVEYALAGPTEKVGTESVSPDPAESTQFLNATDEQIESIGARFGEAHEFSNASITEDSIGIGLTEAATIGVSLTSGDPVGVHFVAEPLFSNTAIGSDSARTNHLSTTTFSNFGITEDSLGVLFAEGSEAAATGDDPKVGSESIAVELLEGQASFVESIAEEEIGVGLLEGGSAAAFGVVDKVGAETIPFWVLEYEAGSGTTVFVDAEESHGLAAIEGDNQEAIGAYFTESAVAVDASVGGPTAKVGSESIGVGLLDDEPTTTYQFSNSIW